VLFRFAWTLGCSALVLSGLACVSGRRDDPGFMAGDAPPTAAELEVVEEFLGVPIPDSARGDLTRARLSRGLDDGLELVLVLDPADVEPFLVELGVEDVLRPSFDAAGVSSRTGWFSIVDGAAILGVTGSDDAAGRGMAATVDVSDAWYSVLYLQYFEV